MSDDDQNVVNQIVQGDEIRSITIEGDISELIALNRQKVDIWNKIIDQRFPHLPKAII
jgi:peptidyl-prolyl cis-trans isomerase B (cyclophilin B)